MQPAVAVKDVAPVIPVRTAVPMLLSEICCPLAVKVAKLVTANDPIIVSLPMGDENAKSPVPRVRTRLSVPIRPHTTLLKVILPLPAEVSNVPLRPKIAGPATEIP